ncbi:MAG: hypothetical protein L3J84_13125 [Gammaproteobacteria bacterium]|nr:hypothetical protein [Gammaproteobacteria bacterium]
MTINTGYKQASHKYERLREIAREAAKENLSSLYSDSSNIMLTDIDSSALKAVPMWLGMTCSRPRAEWSWEEASKIYRKKYPKRFELAIWYKNELCGLSYGRPSFASTRIRIELIEGAPRIGNPLGPKRVVPITIINATAYAGILGAKELRIMNPANALIGYYESLDFIYVNSTGAKNCPDYLYKILK